MDNDTSSFPHQPPVPYAKLKSFLAGAVSGAIAKTSVAPFDRLALRVDIYFYIIQSVY